MYREFQKLEKNLFQWTEREINTEQHLNASQINASPCGYIEHEDSLYHSWITENNPGMTRGYHKY